MLYCFLKWIQIENIYIYIQQRIHSTKHSLNNAFTQQRTHSVSPYHWGLARCDEPTVVVSNRLMKLSTWAGKGGGGREQREIIISKQCNENKEIIRRRELTNYFHTTYIYRDHLSPLW